MSGNNRKLLSAALIVLAIIVIVIIVLNNKNITNENAEIVVDENIKKAVDQTTKNIEEEIAKSNINYSINIEGNKVNTSEEVAIDKKVGNLLLEKNQIIYINGLSKITSKLTNDSIAKDNLSFKVKFIANDGSTIAESVKLIGVIKENEVIDIDFDVNVDVSNAKNIIYEIID